MDKEWFILQVVSGKEKSALGNLQFLQKKYNEDENTQNYISDIRIPEEDVVKITAGKRKTVKQKILPGYLLIELMNLDKDSSEAKKLYSDIVITNGVGAFVGMRGKTPVPVGKEELESVFNRMGESTKVKAVGIKPIVSFEFEVGETVQVSEGPFKGLSGKIELIDLEKRKVKVKIEIFGMPTPVELDALQIEKAY